MDIFSKEMLFAVVDNKAFVRPNLTANGTIGGNSFAVTGSTPTSSSYAVWKAFDNSTSTSYRQTASSCNITFYNPTPIKVTKLILNFNILSYSATVSQIIAGDTSNPSTTISHSLSTSNGITTVTLSNTNYYKYYKIYFTSASSIRLMDVQITAEEQ